MLPATKSVSEIAALLNTDSSFSTYMTATVSVTGTLIITGKLFGSDHTIEIFGNSMEDNVFGKVFAK